MKNKVILISIDGMRPDGLKTCGNPYVKEMEKTCAYTYTARSMNPSVTFPCHFSMTHSVTPQRHGILSNTYVPQVRPVKGIFEKIDAVGGVSAMFYGWEPLRDIALPGALTYATYINAYAKESSDTVLTDAAIRTIEEASPDFVFLYMVETDEKGGHDRSHGSEMAEDMTIPLFFYGKDFAPGEIEKPLSLLNVAPTIAHLMGIEPEKEWEGVSVL